MTDATVIAARRYSELHPGYRIVQAIEAAIPVSWLTLDLLAQERKRLHVVDEFVLRLCDQGVNTLDGIASILGMDSETIQIAVAQQLSAETIDYRPDHNGGRIVVLTPIGKRAAVELATTTPKRVQQPLAFDRLLWKPTSHKKSDLLSRADAAAQHMLILPSVRTHDVTPNDLTPRAINLLSENQQRNDESEIEVLTVEAITRQPRRYLAAVLLIFAATGFDDVRCSVVVDDIASEAYDTALSKAGGIQRLEIQVEQPAGEPELPRDLLDQRVPYETVRNLQRRADKITPPADITSSSVGRHSPDDSATARAELASLTVRSVPVFEHRELLAQAVESARNRFLLAAPWVRDAVVTDDMVNRLEVMLRRPGLTAHIVYGLGYTDRHNDQDALDRLQALARRHSNFTIVHLRDRNPNVLIFDDTWVNSSFNWLSFRGEPTRTYRMEEGTLVRAEAAADERYTRYVSLINRQAAGQG